MLNRSINHSKNISNSKPFTVTIFIFDYLNFDISSYIWSPPILSELTPILFNIDLTHLGSEVYNRKYGELYR